MNILAGNMSKAELINRLWVSKKCVFELYVFRRESGKDFYTSPDIT